MTLTIRRSTRDKEVNAMTGSRDTRLCGLTGWFTRLVCLCVLFAAASFAHAATEIPYPYSNGFETPEEQSDWIPQGNWAISQAQNGRSTYSGSYHLDSNPNSVVQAAGSSSAWLNGVVSIPADALKPVLSFWHHLDLQEGEYMYVYVRPTDTQAWEWIRRYTAGDSHTGYLHETLDLSAYKGRSFELVFFQYSTVDGVRTWLIDNMSIDEEYAYPYSNGFENQVERDQWTLDGIWGVAQAQGMRLNHSGSWHLDNNPMSVAYDGWGEGATLKGRISIPLDAVRPVLSFWYSLDLLEGDRMHVKVLGENSSYWQTIRYFKAGDSRAGYTQETLDLSAFKGQSIQLRFEKRSNSEDVRTWLIDDLFVGEDPVPPTYGYPYSNGFETPAERDQWNLQGSWGISQAQGDRVNYQGNYHLDNNTTNLDPAWYTSTQKTTLKGQISIPANAVRPVLSYWYNLALLADDDMRVKVRTSNSASWDELRAYTSQDKHTAYVRETLDLSAYKGQSIQLMFEQTAGYQYGVRTWLIDDLFVGEEQIPPEYGYPYNNGFESQADQDQWNLQGSWGMLDAQGERLNNSGAYHLDNNPASVDQYQYGGGQNATLNGQISIPEDAVRPLLSIWHHLELFDGDRARIELRASGTSNNEWISIRTYFTWHNSSGYIREDLDLSSYKGQSIQLRFVQDYGDGYGVRIWLIDDLSVKDDPPPPEYGYPYSNGFESQAERAPWDLQGIWAITGSQGDRTSHGGSYHLDNNPTSVVHQSVHERATLNAQFTIPADAVRPVLSYWYKLDLLGSDEMALQVRTADRQSWSWVRSYYSEDSHLGYTKETLDLSAYKGQSIQLRFEKWNDAGVRTWLIDDLYVGEEPVPPEYGYPYSNGFESQADQDQWNLQGSWGMLDAQGERINHSGSYHLDNNPLSVDQFFYWDGQIATLNGQISIPANAVLPVVSYWHKLDLLDGDEIEVQVQTPDSMEWVTLHAYTFLDNHPDYIREDLDLSAYKGRSIRLRFVQMLNFEYGPRTWLIDDLRFGVSSTYDQDGDGTPDIDDPDRDGDGVLNDADAFPDNINEWSDLDGDGIGDNADTDRDGDGVANDQDAFPGDPTESSDLDQDGIGDNADPDRDGDGVANDQDFFPDDPNPQEHGYPYNSGFESQADWDQWNLQGSWGMQAAQGERLNYSGAYHLDNNPASVDQYQYGEGQDATLNGQISIPGDAVRPLLSFWHKLDLFDSDYARVELRASGSNNSEWISIRTYSSWYNSLDYIHDDLDLSAYKGQSIQLRFVQDYGDEHGARIWLIDDLSIKDDPIPPEYGYPYSNGFESQAEQAPWVLQGNWGITDSQGERASHGGSYHLDNNPTSVVHQSVRERATLNAQFTIPADAVRPVLSYWYKLDLLDSDVMFLQVRTSDSGYWSRLRYYFIDDNHLEYTKETLDLSAYKGQSIQLRFEKWNDAGVRTWLIDDLYLGEEPVPSEYGYPYSNGFESQADQDQWNLQGSWGMLDAQGERINHSGSYHLDNNPLAVDQRYYSNGQIAALNGQISIPADAVLPVVSYWHKLDLFDGDEIEVQVQTPDSVEWVTLHTYTYLDNHPDYIREDLDLSAYKGRSIRLRFVQMLNFEYGPRTWLIDDLRFGVSSTYDQDGDGAPDIDDPDRDGDGVLNDADAFPDNINEWSDLDGDGIGDNADTDRDGDGVANDQDFFPDDPNPKEHGYPYSNGFENQADRDQWSLQGSWGMQDAQGERLNHSGAYHLDNNPANLDQFENGERQIATLNGQISIPEDAVLPQLSFWYHLGLLDGDYARVELRASGAGNNEWISLRTYYTWDNSSGYIREDLDLSDYKGQSIQLRFAYHLDGYEYGPRTWLIDDLRLGDSPTNDQDGDGTPDIDDPDRDGDGVLNDADAFPDNINEWSDLDGDGIGDNADTDRDGDGVANELDLFPDDPSESADLDGDGIGDNGDTDLDGDGIPNNQDTFPYDPGPSTSTSERITYYHSDALGSPVAATDESGQVIWRESYQPYGERVKKEASDNRQWFTGKSHNERLGLSYFGARWYDPSAGRFISPDPVDGIDRVPEHAFNRYAYANNNPYRYVDPDGRDAVGIVYKWYQVNTGFGFNLPLGHAGVLLINNDNGFTKYYEYGRYNPNGKGIIGEKLDQMKGNIRNVPVPNAVLGEDGKPTKKSLNGIYKHLSKTAGKGYEAATEYHEGADFTRMEKYVQDIANDKNRDKYSVPFCNCYDFKNSVIDAGNKKE